MLAAPQFDAPAGTIVGWRDGAVLRATGIRFARAGRFQPPVAELPAPAPIVATDPACPQMPGPLLPQAFGGVATGMEVSEDCLRLSVTLPADWQAGEQLPVLVWVHGGSYVSGAGDLPLYDPAALVSEQRLVFVAVTYRLGLLGWLGSAGAPPPNLGLRDVREALRWVQRNIAAFGGDPARVTLLGQSLGADAIAHLLVAQATRGLVRRVILHSAPLGLARGRHAMSRAMTPAAGSLAPTATLEQVLARERAAAAAASRCGLKGSMPFGTQYGAYPLPAESAIDQAWEAIAPEIDVLIGATAEETRFFALIDPKYRRLGQLPLVGRLLLRLLVLLSTWLVYVAGSQAFARRPARTGGRAYYFTVLFQPTGSAFGAAHTADLPLLLGTRATWLGTPLLGQATWEEVEAAGRQLRQLWGDFARTGQLPAHVSIPEVLLLNQV